MREKIRRVNRILPFVLCVLTLLAALNTYSSRSAELPAHSTPNAGGSGAGKLPALSGKATAQEIYSDSVRTSQYVTVRDGTHLAIDIYRPAAGGVVVDKRFPVVLVATPYHRSSENNGEIVTFLAPAGNHQSIFDAILKHGYVIASLDIRGRGASFGTVYAGGFEADVNRQDLYDVIEWLAVQPWSDGNIGMGGCSYVAKTQFWAASGMPPHLKAIAPSGSPFDPYGLLRVNGISHLPGLLKLDRALKALDTTVLAPRVDDDKSGALRQAAIDEHRLSWDKGLAGFTAARADNPFRDSVSRPEYANSATPEWTFIHNYSSSRIPVFQFAGWRDFALDHSLAWYRNLARQGVPQKLIIGPWYHCEWDQSDLLEATAEYLRWYDYWLRGVKNGLLDGPKIRYYVNNASAGHEWHSSDRWPLPNQAIKTYFLGGPAAPGNSKPDNGGDMHQEGGTLGTEKPHGLNSADRYMVDYSVTTANLPTRFFWGIPDTKDPGLKPIEMASVDEKSLAYTSAPLPGDSEITGFPRVTLWVSSTASDQDFFVYLEEVDEKGVSVLLTDGMIRASNRATRQPPFDNEGLPWHPSLAGDQSPLPPGVPAKLEFALYPVSNFIKKGHRIRLTVAAFDKGGWNTPQLTPAPTVSIFHDSKHQSFVSLPFIR
jgi:putative CocE/NonD family hydrolase